MSIFGRSGDETTAEQEYRVVARDPTTGDHASIPDEIDGSEWRFPADDTPTKEQFRFEFGDALDPNLTYICAPVDGRYVDFDDVRWHIEPQAPQLDEEDRLRAIIREEMDGGGGGGGNGSLREEMAMKVLDGEADPRRAEKALRFMEDGAAGPSLAETVDDPTDLGEVGGRSLLAMTEGYNTWGELVEDVFGGVLRGAGDAEAGPATSHPERERSERPARPREREREREPRRSRLREEFERERSERDRPAADANGAADTENPDDATDATPEAPEARSEDSGPDIKEDRANEVSEERSESGRPSDRGDSDRSEPREPSGSGLSDEPDDGADPGSNDAPDADSDLVYPQNATELETLDWPTWKALAADIDAEYPANLGHASREDLRPWLKAQLFGDSSDAADDEPDPAPDGREDPPPDGPVTHSTMTASPDVADVIEGADDDAAATDGGGR